MTRREERFRALIGQLRSDLDGFSDAQDRAIPLWSDKVNYLINKIDGPRGSLAIRFNGIPWHRIVPGGQGGMTVSLSKDPFQMAKSKCDSILSTLEFLLDQQQETLDDWDAVIDPELWQHVSGLVMSEDWNKVAREVTVFLEGKLRVWGELQSVKGSVDVFKQAIGRDGIFPLGNELQPSEQDGWGQLGTGFALAIRNSVSHGSERDRFAKQYAMGVLGLASLIVTELKTKYGDPPVRVTRK